MSITSTAKPSAHTPPNDSDFQEKAIKKPLYNLLNISPNNTGKTYDSTFCFLPPLFNGKFFKPLNNRFNPAPSSTKKPLTYLNKFLLNEKYNC